MNPSSRVTLATVVRLGELYLGLALIGVAPGLRGSDSMFSKAAGTFLLAIALWRMASPATPRPAPLVFQAGDYEVVLTAAGPRRIEAIKAVREISGLGLKDAKDLVEGPPRTVRQGISKEDAERVKATLAEHGASAEVRASAGSEEAS